MEPVMMALNNLGLNDRCSLEFCCEKDEWCKSFIWQNHHPKIMNDDITRRDAATLPRCDLYVAGFPCQPFSTAGLRQGAKDPRGTIIQYILDYLRIGRPRSFILENVAGLLQAKFAHVFQYILAELRAIRDKDGSHYEVSYRLVNTADWGLPHNRERVYIVGLWSSMMNRSAPFCWPRKTKMRPMEQLLDNDAKSTLDAAIETLTPNSSERLLSYLKSLHERGHNPDCDTWIIDIWASKPFGMKGKSPCLTRSRAGAGGHWITTSKRLMTLPEMLRLQGVSPKVNRTGISDRQMGCMIGNAMSVNVLERLLVRLLPAVGLVSPGCLRDRWA
jgi:DNA-cytosine methyltransferase